MSFILTRTNGDTQQIQDAIIDTSKYSFGILGRNITGYGQTFAQATVNKLENFANGTSPIQPIPGQLWFDSGTNYIRINSSATDGNNIWDKAVSADASNNIGSDIDAYNTIYINNIEATNIYTSDLGSQLAPINTLYSSNIGSVGYSVNNIYVDDVVATSVGSSSDPVDNIYVDTLGSSGNRINTIYVNVVDSFSADASELNGQLPSYYLDYNNFTNVPNYTSQFVDVVGDTMTGNLTMSSSSLLLDHDPTVALEAATKQYADTLSSDIYYKNSCRVTTTANITLSGTQTIDGVSLLVGDRVLVKNQSTASQNGIYDVAAGAWTRSTDADGSPSSEVTSGMFTFILEGFLYENTGWVLTTSDPITVGSTSLSFSQASAETVYTSGLGIDLIGTVFSADFGTIAGTVSEGNHTHSNATGSVDGFMSATDKTKLDGIASGAEVNQNTFSSVAVSGQSTIVADSKTDTFTVVEGTGITLTTNSSIDMLTITNSAPNVNQTINAGTGLSGGGSGGSVTINNTDLGSSQNIFKNVATNSGTAIADNNNATLSIIGSGGISTSVSGDTLTINGSGAGGSGIVDGSPTQNGYMTFSGGFTIQWGRIGPFDEATNNAFSFPIPFTTFYTVTGSLEDDAISTENRLIQFNGMTNSGGFVCNLFLGSTPGVDQTYVRYVATGII